MKEIILIKNGEIALKGLNKHTFEDMLIKNAKRRLKSLGDFKFSKAQSTIYAVPADESIDLDEAVRRLSHVFGIVGLSRACVVEKDFEDIKEKAITYLADELESARTFKVVAKRSDKKFPMKSPEICRELGGHILSHFHHLKVDVYNPDVVVCVEVRDFAAYIHANQLPGAGGLPIGSSGKAALLVSGGIDSPVAGYMMAKRGIEVSAIHFVSPPYTSDRALLKVEELLEKMCEYCGRINFTIVPFTHIQEEIRDKCPDELFTIIMRRYMMKLSERIAKQNDCAALITGESVAQVASQTMQAIACTDCACSMPVFRPVIGMDKTEIIEISRKIDTYETSIQPYEDCCTVFTPKHPRTKPTIEMVLKAEEALDENALIEEAMANLEYKTIFANM